MEAHNFENVDLVSMIKKTSTQYYAQNHEPKEAHNLENIHFQSRACDSVTCFTRRSVGPWHFAFSAITGVFRTTAPAQVLD